MSFSWAGNWASRTGSTQGHRFKAEPLGKQKSPVTQCSRHLISSSAIQSQQTSVQAWSSCLCRKIPPNSAHHLCASDCPSSSSVHLRSQSYSRLVAPGSHHHLKMITFTLLGKPTLFPNLMLKQGLVFQRTVHRVDFVDTGGRHRDNSESCVSSFTVNQENWQPIHSPQPLPLPKATSKDSST